MSEQINHRKIEHIQIINQDSLTDRQGNYFDRIQLNHRALPELDFNDVDTRCEFLGYQLSFPLLISSMTGGDHDLIKTINKNLAIAAEQTGVAMAVGSQRILLASDAAKESFELRQYAPNIPLIGNLGAVNLNYGIEIKDVRKVIDILSADALYLHLNPLQEVIQPEGDTNFADLANKIKGLNEQLEIPLFLKEVGCGLSKEDVELGLFAGIKVFDLAGAGGTSWSRIEASRSKSSDMGLLFQDWGIPTPKNLDLLKGYHDKAQFIASGGLRNGLDMVKSVIMGAVLCGLAKPLLKPAMESADAVIKEIEILQKTFKTAMFLLGVSNIRTLFNNRSLIMTG